MKKATYYFAHDYGARNDPKLLEVQRKLGLAGIGAYWCIVEMMYEQGGELEQSYTSLAYTLRCDESFVSQLINDFSLFEVDSNGRIISQSIRRRLEKTNDVKEKRRQAGKKSWEVRSKINDNQDFDVNINQGKIAEENTTAQKVNVLINDLPNYQIKNEQFIMSMHITQQEFLDYAREIFSEWIAVNDEDVSWRHLVNHMRVKIRQERSGKSKPTKTAKSVELMQDSFRNLENILKNGINNQ